jgi:hypothetical protein
MVQVVEYLPSKCEALCSNPSMTKNKINKIRDSEPGMVSHAYNLSTQEIQSGMIHSILSLSIRY